MRFAFGVEQNVARLDVSMQNAVFMRVVNRARQFRDEFRCVSDRDPRALCHFIELSAIDELHAEVAGTLAFAHFVNGNNAWMIQTGGGFSFPTKALQMCFGCPRAQAYDFERNCAVQTFLVRAINDSLAAAAD